MASKIIEELKSFVAQQGWTVAGEREIDHGTQIVVVAPGGRWTVNFYTTGKILVGGRAGPIRVAIQAWADQSIGVASADESSKNLGAEGQRSQTTYFVLAHRIDSLWHDVIPQFPAQVNLRQVTGPGQLYAAEIREAKDKVVLTQYRTGNLLVQGASSVLFELVYLALDEHLGQNLQQRADRFVVSEPARKVAEEYIKQPQAEDEATAWLNRQLPTEVQRFLHENDLLTLRSGTAVRNALTSIREPLPDYSVIVAGFGRAFEGFVIRLSEHLGLATEDKIKRKADAIQIGNWISGIEGRLPDKTRYSAEIAALNSAWQCRNKAMHSDRFHPYRLTTSDQADQEITTILRAMGRAHAVFVAQGIKLEALIPATSQKSATQSRPREKKRQFDAVDHEALAERLRADRMEVKRLPNRSPNEWQVITTSVKVIAQRGSTSVTVVGPDTDAFCKQYHDLLNGRAASAPPAHAATTQAHVGVDESGKGDVFGPLVIAAVVTTPDSANKLEKAGVKDSKQLDRHAIEALAKVIRQECEHVVIRLMPTEYNSAYREIGSNLNRLLAKQHAIAVRTLGERAAFDYAVSDQFASDEAVLTKAFRDEGVATRLIQRHQAESDIAVAAASILARQAFVESVEALESISGCPLPLGSSSPKVRQTAEQIRRRRGSTILSQVAKSHFSTVSDLC